MQFIERSNFFMFFYILELAETHIALVNVVDKY